MKFDESISALVLKDLYEVVASDQPWLKGWILAQYHTYQAMMSEEVIASAASRIEAVWTVPCPLCPAGIGEPCVDTLHYPRQSNHRERVSNFSRVKKQVKEAPK